MLRKGTKIKIITAKYISLAEDCAFDKELYLPLCVNSPSKRGRSGFEVSLKNKPKETEWK